MSLRQRMLDTINDWLASGGDKFLLLDALLAVVRSELSIPTTDVPRAAVGEETP